MGVAPQRCSRISGRWSRHTESWPPEERLGQYSSSLWSEPPSYGVIYSLQGARGCFLTSNESQLAHIMYRLLYKKSGSISNRVARFV